MSNNKNKTENKPFVLTNKMFENGITFADDFEITSEIKTRANDEHTGDGDDKIYTFEQIKQSVKYNLKGEDLANILKHCVKSWNIKLQTTKRKFGKSFEDATKNMKTNPSLIVETKTYFKPSSTKLSSGEQAVKFVPDLNPAELDQLELAIKNARGNK